MWLQTTKTEWLTMNQSSMIDTSCRIKCFGWTDWLADVPNMLYYRYSKYKVSYVRTYVPSPELQWIPPALTEGAQQCLCGHSWQRDEGQFCHTELIWNWRGLSVSITIAIETKIKKNQGRQRYSQTISKCINITDTKISESPRRQLTHRHHSQPSSTPARRDHSWCQWVKECCHPGYVKPICDSVDERKTEYVSTVRTSLHSTQQRR